MKEALIRFQEYLSDDIYLIPVKLEECEIPEEIRHLNWVNLFEPNGFTQLVNAIQFGMERREKEASADGEPPSGTAL